MKNLILIILLFSASLHASTFYNLKRQSGEVTHARQVNDFDTDLPVNWGYIKEGWYRKSNVEEMGLSIVGRTTKIEEGVTKYWVDKNYTIEVINTDAEEAAAEAARLERIADLEAIKLMIEDVNNSGLPAWHRRLLKRLIRDMK